MGESMLKVLLGCCIIAFGCFCGYLLAKRYRQRRHFFRQFFEFNERFLNEIAYYRRPIQEFVSKHSYYGDFEVFLKSYFTSLKGGDFEILEYTFLKEEEKAFLYDYFQMLGKGDSASQKAYFSSAHLTLAKWKENSNQEGKKYEDLYIKLGFLCGLFVLILII